MRFSPRLFVLRTQSLFPSSEQNLHPSIRKEGYVLLPVVPARQLILAAASCSQGMSGFEGGTLPFVQTTALIAEIVLSRRK